MVKLLWKRDPLGFLCLGLVSLTGVGILTVAAIIISVWFPILLIGGIITMLICLRALIFLDENF